MPSKFTFSKTTGQYKWRSNGRIVSNERLSSEVDLVSSRIGERLGEVAELLRSKKINDAEWVTRSADLIRDGHRAVAIIAGGGRENMTPADWGFVGSRIKSELAYLSGFALEIEGRTDKDRLTAAFVTRARSYSAAIYPTYEQATRRRHMRDGTASHERNILEVGVQHCDQCIEASVSGIVPFGTLIPIGERTCISRCRCHIVYSIS